MTDLESFLCNVTGSEANVKKALHEAVEIVEKYRSTGRIDVVEVAHMASLLLPGKKEVKGTFLVQPIVGGKSHPGVTGSPDSTVDVLNTKSGQWVGDSSRSAVWINEKLDYDKKKGAFVYELYGSVMPWSPLCRGGSVPAIRVKRKRKIKELRDDGVHFAKGYTEDPQSPDVNIYPFTGDRTKDDIDRVQKDQLISSSTGNTIDDMRSKIKYHRNIE